MRKKMNTPPPPPKETRLKVAENTDLMSFLLAKMGRNEPKFYQIFAGTSPGNGEQ